MAGVVRDGGGDQRDGGFGLVDRGDADQAGGQDAEAGAARAEVNDIRARVLGTRRIVVVTVGIRVGSVPFLHEMQGIFDDFPCGRKQCQQKEGRQSGCREALHLAQIYAPTAQLSNRPRPEMEPRPNLP